MMILRLPRLTTHHRVVYGIGVPLFVVAMPFAMVGAVAGAAAHPWTKCHAMEGRFEGPEVHLAGADR